MSLNSQLSRSTGFFGLRLWVVIGIGLGVFTILILFLLTVWLASSRRRSRNAYEKFPSFCSGVSVGGVGGGSSSSFTTSAAPRIPAVSKEIKEVVVPSSASSPAEGVLLTISDKDTSKPDNKVYVHVGFNRRGGAPAVGVEMGSGAGRRRFARSEIEASPCNNALEIVPAGGVYPDDAVSSDGGGGGVGRHRSQRYSDGSCVDVVLAAPPAATPGRGELGWGYWFTLRDLESATGGFAPDNVLGEGGYGIVYRGCLVDGTQVAVKSLLNNRGQAEKEFRVEVEAIGRVRHKNLVRLLGYCVEGNYRMLVYEYVDNGNLEQWLHGPASILNSPTWEVRVKIALGTAKALAYLHEALEPKVVHRDIKASNILLDAHWNARISDFGLAKMLGSENSHIKTRVMGTFGYVAPEYANTGLLNERSDVYSFGVLLMEMISGRDPVDYGRPAGEVNLVDWVKQMVGCRRSEEVADDRLDSRPSGRALKRALLVALRCVDPDAAKRPRMGQVVHLLENDELTSRDDSRSSREPTSRRPTSEISNEDVASVSESC